MKLILPQIHGLESISLGTHGDGSIVLWITKGENICGMKLQTKKI